MGKVPFFRISLTNATLLSALYLGLGVLVEVARRVSNPRWVDGVSFSMEAFPARMLALVGALEPLREAYQRGDVSNAGVRAIYGAVAVGVIYATGLFVGTLMWGVSKLGRRPSEP